jgi:hypothetical protein
MRTLEHLSLFLLLAAPAWAAPQDAVTFVNAEVVRVDDAGRTTFRTESGITVIGGNDGTRRGASALRAGDKVLLTYRTHAVAGSTPRRVVTRVERAAPTSGESRQAPATTTTLVFTPGGGVVRGSATTANDLPSQRGGALVAVAPPVSPYTQTVPSLPPPVPQVGAVLPPATVPVPEGDVDRRRTQAERDLDAAALVLAASANDLDAQWARFAGVCIEGPKPREQTGGRAFFHVFDDQLAPPDNDGCRRQLDDLGARAATFEAQLEIATGAARQAGVLPGRIREALGRHQLLR